MLHDHYDSIDVSTLSKTDRLGLACCRLNSLLWDEILGPKPEGFDELPRFSKDVERLFHRRQHMRSKYDYTRPAYHAIESIIGEANTSRCYWKFTLGRSEDEWFRWYTVERFLSPEERMSLQKQPRR